MRALILAVGTAAAVVLAGCGGDGPRGTVHGTVKFQGKPLTGAAVIFVASDNKTHVLSLSADGAYTVTGVAYGPVKVSVQQEKERIAVKGQFDAPSSEAKGVKDEKAGAAPPVATRPKAGATIPARYADANTSGLGFELKQPEQEWSVDLK